MSSDLSELRVDQRKNVPGQGGQMCNGPEAAQGLAYSRECPGPCGWSGVNQKEEGKVI